MDSSDRAGFRGHKGWRSAGGRQAVAENIEGMSPMQLEAMKLEEIGSTIRTHLETKDQAREAGLVRSRQVIRRSSIAIRAIHRDEYDEARAHLQAADDRLREAQAALKDYPDIYYAGFLQDAEKEYCEGRTTLALVTGEALPQPDELAVGYPPYLSGVGEAMGELRRHILDLIRKDDLGNAERLLGAMDDIYYFLVSFDFPEALTPGLRRISDLAKSVMEKTRGDLTSAIRGAKLAERLAEVEENLGKS